FARGRPPGNAAHRERNRRCGARTLLCLAGRSSRGGIGYAESRRWTGREESRMNMPRIFLGSSGKQAKLLQAIERGLEDVADVEPWTTTFNPGRSTLDRLVELSQEVDFAAFVFAQDD